MRLIFAVLLLSSILSSAGAAEDIRFEKGLIKLGSVILRVEFARTEKEQARGLMHRRSLDEKSGMLFIYKDEALRSFWMKNTFVPLSIGFFNKNRELVDIQEMQPVTSEMQIHVPTYQSAMPAMYALEVPQGWFRRNNIKLNAKFNFVSDSR